MVFDLPFKAYKWVTIIFFGSLKSYQQKTMNPSYYYKEMIKMVVNSKNTLVSDKPRTTLGKRLKEIRARIIDSGEKLLDWDDLEIELLERKGEKRRQNIEETNLC